MIMKELTENDKLFGLTLRSLLQKFKNSELDRNSVEDVYAIVNDADKRQMDTLRYIIGGNKDFCTATFIKMLTEETNLSEVSSKFMLDSIYTYIQMKHQSKVSSTSLKQFITKEEIDNLKLYLATILKPGTFTDYYVINQDHLERIYNFDKVGNSSLSNLKEDYKTFTDIITKNNIKKVPEFNIEHIEAEKVGPRTFGEVMDKDIDISHCKIISIVNFISEYTSLEIEEGLQFYIDWYETLMLIVHAENNVLGEDSLEAMQKIVQSYYDNNILKLMSDDFNTLDADQLVDDLSVFLKEVIMVKLSIEIIFTLIGHDFKDHEEDYDTALDLICRAFLNILTLSIYFIDYEGKRTTWGEKYGTRIRKAIETLL